MLMPRWIGRRLEYACLVLHLSEGLFNVAVVQCCRRFMAVSILTQLVMLLMQMTLGRLCVISYFYWHSSRTMPRAKTRLSLPTIQEVILIIQESLIGAWGLYSVLHPFARLFAQSYGSTSGTSTVKYPVLFIHGYVCNAGYWYPILRYLSTSGVRSLYTITLEPLYLDIPSYADQVAKRVEWIMEETGSEKVILVGHSMGGLVARAYMKWHNANRVAKLITLQTPHQGTEIASTPLARSLFRGDSVSDMLPGSQFLKDLGSPEESNHDGAIPMTSVFSYHDTLITPQESSIMAAPNTTNIPCSGIGHLVMPFVPHIQKLILHELLDVT